tara:strand:- start:25 stop:327 length:303 start_codon:yes stop_codon:yes gene_type:complete
MKKDIKRLIKLNKLDNDFANGIGEINGVKYDFHAEFGIHRIIVDVHYYDIKDNDEAYCFELSRFDGNPHGKGFDSMGEAIDYINELFNCDLLKNERSVLG